MTEPSAPISDPSGRTPPSERLVALDVLRGFDMFWILGMEEFAAALARANDAPWTKAFSRQLDHAVWEGFRFLDLIFPLFVFVSGVSLALSAKRSMAEFGRARTVRKIVVRAVILYLVGVLFYGGLAKGMDGVRWVGVLQRIAISGLAAGLLFCLTSLRIRLAALGGLLLGYWAALALIAPPGGARGDFAEGPTHNLANWLDSRFLPGRRWDGTHDPEGLLSSLPAIATCLLGVLIGEYVSAGSGSRAKKAFVLFGGGAVLAAAGWAWHPYFPVIKKLWTSSFVLVAGGYSLMLFGTLLLIVDVFRLRRWASPFVWIGMNAIALFLAKRYIKHDLITGALVGGPIADALGDYAAVVRAFGIVVLAVVLAAFLHRHRIFMRI